MIELQMDVDAKSRLPFFGVPGSLIKGAMID